MQLVPPRSRRREWMDRDGNRTEDLEGALRDIALTNRWLGGRSAILDAIDPYLSQASAAPLEILDVGTGGGDIPLAVVERARRVGRGASVVGVDLDPVTVDLAARRLGRYSAVRLVRGDARRLPFADGSFDLVVASMFLHHFDEAEVVDLLKQFRRLARRAVVINDLRRHLVPFLFISIVARLAVRHPMYVHDAPLSVLRGFTREELRRAADASGARTVELRRRWPYRLVLVLPAESAA